MTSEDDLSWRDAAECYDKDEIWALFGNGQEQKIAVRQFCMKCPVLDDCAEYALDNRIEFGVWGGLTEEDRRKIRRRRRRSA